MKINELMLYASASKMDFFCEDNDLITFTGDNLHYAVDQIIHSNDKKLWISIAERESAQLSYDSKLHHIECLSAEDAKKMLVYCKMNKVSLLQSKNHNPEFLKSIINSSSLLDTETTNTKIDEWQKALISDAIKREANDFINSYAHGKCHLFALVAAEIMNRNITVYWDIEAEDGNGGYIDEDCLVHAFIKNNDNEMIDINGVSDMEDTLSEYPCNKGIISEYSPKQFKSIIIKKGWEAFEKGEAKKITAYIKENLPCIEFNDSELSLSL